MILSYDEAHSLLDEIAERFPPVFFEELHGAVLLLPEEVQDEDDELITLGMYCHDALGRRIELYYGSFLVLAKEESWTRETWKDELYATLSHEFTHHMENLAGESGLERKDEAFLIQHFSDLPPTPPRAPAFSLRSLFRKKKDN